MFRVALTPEWVYSTRNAPKPLPISYHQGVVEPGGALPVDEASTIAVCGFLGCDLKPFNPLIAAAPRILHLPAARAGDWVGRVIDQAVAEFNHPRPGGDAVLERLSEMMFVDAARRYLDDLIENVPQAGWRLTSGVARITEYRLTHRTASFQPWHDLGMATRRSSSRH